MTYEKRDHADRGRIFATTLRGILIQKKLSPERKNEKGTSVRLDL